MKPEFAIIEERLHNDFTILTIDTANASYQGIPWRTLGDFGKRKFENLLIIMQAPKQLRILYV